MFWRAIGFVAVLLGFAAWGLAQYRWTERMFAAVNKNRPRDKQIPVIAARPFQALEARREYRRMDPVGYRKAMIRSGISGLLLMAALIGLMNF
jgi:hypothetical protein